MNQTLGTGFGPGSPANGSDYGNYGSGPGGPQANYGGMTGATNRNVPNNFFLPPGPKYGGPSSRHAQGNMNQTAYGASGFGQLRNKSNGAKLSQYQGVHGTIQLTNKANLGGAVKTPVPGTDRGEMIPSFNNSIMDPHTINNMPVDSASITPQEVAAFYANAMNAAKIVNQRRMKTKQ